LASTAAATPMPTPTKILPTKPKPRDNKIAFLMLAPGLTLLGIFVIWPLIYAWGVSFYTWSFYEDSVFVGLRNFRLVLDDPNFSASIVRGLVYTIIVVPVILTIAFIFANVVKMVGAKAGTWLKVSIYIPTVISGVIASIIFVLIYEFRQGLLNWLLSFFGTADTAWLGSARTALYALTVPGIWMGLGLASLIMLAGLLDIPETYYEAAELDGAGWFGKTFYITIPLMKNIILYLLVTGFVAAVQQFELPLVMTGGGPTRSTLLPNLLIFQRFTNDLYVGYSIAAALLLFLVLGGISAVIFKLINSEKAVDA
jgi:ABC-type sugar transport system permease subunit